MAVSRSPAAIGEVAAAESISLGRDDQGHGHRDYESQRDDKKAVCETRKERSNRRACNKKRPRGAPVRASRESDAGDDAAGSRDACGRY
jgi:hypothetical protein